MPGGVAHSAGESADDFANLLDEMIKAFQPCDSVEYLLVHDIARADWVKQRGSRRSWFERSKAYIEAASDREALDVEEPMSRNYSHILRPVRSQLWGVTEARTFDRAGEVSRREERGIPTGRWRCASALQSSAKGCDACWLLAGHSLAGAGRT